MKILAVRGRNLASLAAPFALDFTAHPLADAGLFAIVGETGAGKSTILDALCLALYGEFPRLKAGEGSDKLPDAGGEAMEVSDPRSILRIGAVDAVAEAEVAIGSDVLLARWEARRARGKAGGRLQPAERSLIDKASGTVIASGKTNVEREINERLGLSYDQFRRTVLLSQNQFDAFLRASDSERAELLERITGTEIYARLSQAAFERERAARQALDELQRESGTIMLLGEAERAALAAGIGTAEQRRQSLDRPALSLRSALEAQARAAEAKTRAAEAAASQQRAQSAFAAAASERQLLAKLSQIEPLRAVWQQASAAASEWTALQQELTAHEADATGRRDRHATLIEQQRALQTRLATALAEQQRLLPLIDAAISLDHQLAAATAALTELGHKRQAAEAAAGRAAADLAALERRQTEQTEHLAWLAGDRERPAGSMLVADTDEDIEAAFASLGQRLATATAAAAELTRLRRQRDGLAASDADRTEREQQARIDAAQATAHDATVHLSTAAAEVAGRLAESAAREINHGETEAELTRLEAVLSEEVVRLRASLEDGVACPVCGSTGHPGHDEPLARRRVGELKQRRRQIEAERQAAEAVLAGVRREAEAARIRLALLAAGRDEVSRQFDAAAARVERLGEQRAELLDGHPASQVRDAAAAAIDMAQQQVTATGLAARELESGLGELEKLIGRQQDLATRRAAESARLEAARDAALSRIGLPIAEATALMALSEAERETCRQRVAALEAALAETAARANDRARHAEAMAAACEGLPAPAESEAQLAGIVAEQAAVSESLGRDRQKLAADDAAQARHAGIAARIAAAGAAHLDWQAVSEAIGSRDGMKFRRFAQAVTLDHLIALANRQLEGIAPRYRIERSAEGGLALQVLDLEMGGERRSVRSLSGGERFLVSLALALSLSRLDGGRAHVDTLLIDEGFGALDARSLDMAVEALERLQSEGRRVGVISHVEALKERIPVQVLVEKQGDGRSRVRVVEPGYGL